MANHPNRSTRGETVRPAPTPEQVREAREGLEMTQTDAAASIYATLRTWQDWEAGVRKMHPAMFELFQLKHGLVSIRDVKRG